MNANELRIGNLVYTTLIDEDDLLRKKDDNLHIVDADDIKSISDWEFNGKKKIKGIYCISYPIPLTEEWLLKFGFKKETLGDDEGFFYSYRLKNDVYCDLSFLSGDKNGYLEVTLFPYEQWFRYRYIHQLQNLYFALTGEELKIKS